MYRPDGRVEKLRRSSSAPGAARELTFSCYRRLPLLGKNRTREWMIESLKQVQLRRQARFLAYVLMPEHVHLLLVPASDAGDIRALLQGIKQPVAQRAMEYLRCNAPGFIAKLQDRRGKSHFWQVGGGYDRAVISPQTAWASVRYIHHNPVKRGLVENPLDWPWSSAGWYAGAEDCVLDMDAAPPSV